MIFGKKARRFPVKPKAVFKEAIIDEAMLPNITPFPGIVYNKIVPFPSLRYEGIKTKAVILNFPVRE